MPISLHVFGANSHYQLGTGPTTSPLRHPMSLPLSLPKSLFVGSLSLGVSHAVALIGQAQAQHHHLVAVSHGSVSSALCQPFARGPLAPMAEMSWALGKQSSRPLGVVASRDASWMWNGQEVRVVGGSEVVWGRGRQGTPLPVRLTGSIATARVCAIGAGLDHVLMLDTDGQVHGMGFTPDNQLGDLAVAASDDPVVKVPTRLALPTRTAIRAVAAGYDTSAAIDTTGTLYTAGLGDHGQLARDAGTRGFAVVPSVRARRVAAGAASLTVESESDELLTFDARGCTSLRGPRLPLLDLSSGQGHTLAVDADGILWGWGTNADGCLGLGEDVPDDTVLNQPTKIPLEESAKVSVVAAGGNSSMAA